ncbi:hypothetical protein CHS0354_024674, partial [Potamilus streckersoni]
MIHKPKWIASLTTQSLCRPRTIVRTRDNHTDLKLPLGVGGVVFEHNKLYKLCKSLPELTLLYPETHKPQNDHTTDSKHQNKGHKLNYYYPEYSCFYLQGFVYHESPTYAKIAKQIRPASLKKNAPKDKQNSSELIRPYARTKQNKKKNSKAPAPRTTNKETAIQGNKNLISLASLINHQNTLKSNTHQNTLKSNTHQNTLKSNTETIHQNIRFTIVKFRNFSSQREKLQTQ